MPSTDSKLSFPELTLVGDARERGHAHGEAKRTAIAEVLDYYLQLFGVSIEKLCDEARNFASIIHTFNADHAREIEAIAEAAGQDPLLIYALNSRSEILNNVTQSECTSVFSEEQGLLAQNWDWSERLEQLVFLARIEGPGRHRLVTLTEPGILGKIGMNNRGIGVSLNILKHPEELRGLPVHVLLRSILDCDAMDEVESLLDVACVGKASHVLVASAEGACLSSEFAGTRTFRLSLRDGVLVHTNHYLAAEASNSLEAFPTTHERYEQALGVLCRAASAENIEALLRDQSRGVQSICRPYSPSDTPGFGNVGTVFTVVMELAVGEMHIHRGPKSDATPYRVRV
jgi:isopenicillin-N N-acyltransferase-like protein